jgi:IS30 family transposase
MSEKVELTDEERKLIEKYAAELNQTQIADLLDISDKTLRAIFKRDRAARSAYKRGKAKATHEVANSLIQEAKNGNISAAIFYLKTQAGWKEEAQKTIDLPVLQIVSPNASE